MHNLRINVVNVLTIDLCENMLFISFVLTNFAELYSHLFSHGRTVMDVKIIRI